MKKTVVVFATILALGVLAADAVLQQPVAVFAAQAADTQAEQPKDNAKDGQGGKADDGHSGHH